MGKRSQPEASHEDLSDGGVLFEKATRLKLTREFVSTIGEHDPGVMLVLNKTSLWTPAHASSPGLNFANVGAAIDTVRKLFVDSGLKVSDGVDTQHIDTNIVVLTFSGSGVAHDEALDQVARTGWLKRQPNSPDIGTMISLYPERGALKYKQNMSAFNV